MLTYKTDEDPFLYIYLTKLAWIPTASLGGYLGPKAQYPVTALHTRLGMRHLRHVLAQPTPHLP